MSEQGASKYQVVALSLIPVLFLIAVEGFFLQQKEVGTIVMAHFAMAVLFAQLLLQIVFYKGEICNGQRSRLSRFNLYFFLFWIGWLLLTFFQVQVYIPLRLLYVTGIILTLSTFRQPKELQLRQPILLLGIFSGIIGLLLGSFTLIMLPLSFSLSYNPFLQFVLAVALAYWGLLVSRNRLQNFIQLLPLIAALLLIISAMFSAILLWFVYLNNIELTITPLALSCYFIGHILLLVVWTMTVIKRRKHSYWSLAILLGIAALLPLLLG